MLSLRFIQSFIWYTNYEVYIFYCCITNHYKSRCLKQYSFISSQSCSSEIWTMHIRVLCPRSDTAEIEALPHFFLGSVVVAQSSSYGCRTEVSISLLSFIKGQGSVPWCLFLVKYTCPFSKPAAKTLSLVKSFSCFESVFPGIMLSFWKPNMTRSSPLRIIFLSRSTVPCSIN